MLNNRKQQSPQTHTHTHTGGHACTGARVQTHAHRRTSCVGYTWPCRDTRTCMDTDAHKYMYTDVSMHTHAQTHVSGHAHSRTYSCVREYTHRGLHTLPFPILAPNSMQPPSAPSSPSSPDLSPPIPEAPGSAQTPREHAHTCILHQNTLLGKYFCRGKPMEAPLISSALDHLVPQFYLPAVKNTVTP